MAIQVLGIHHHATRIDAGPEQLAAVQNFYKDVLGLGADSGRPTIAGVPGFWINVGGGGQIHLIGGAQPSTLAKGPGQDPPSRMSRSRSPTSRRPRPSSTPQGAYPSVRIHKLRPFGLAQQDQTESVLSAPVSAEQLICATVTEPGLILGLLGRDPRCTREWARPSASTS